MLELVNRHHEAQKLIAANVVGELSVLWNILDFHDLDGTTAPWLKAIRPIIETGFLTSQYVAAGFVNKFRGEMFHDEEPLLLDVPNPLGLFGNQRIPHRETGLKIMISMKVTGPGWVIKNSAPGVNEDQVMRDGFSKSSGAAIRLVLNGGRGLVRMAADIDPLAIGVIGVCDEDESSCEGCQFLARHVIPKSQPRKMNAIAIGHDFCRCSARLVYAEEHD